MCRWFWHCQANDCNDGSGFHIYWYSVLLGTRDVPGPTILVKSWCVGKSHACIAVVMAHFLDLFLELHQWSCRFANCYSRATSDLHMTSGQCFCIVIAYGGFLPAIWNDCNRISFFALTVEAILQFGPIYHPFHRALCMVATVIFFYLLLTAIKNKILSEPQWLIGWHWY